MGKSVTRLYDQFQPEHYQLHLAPDAEKMHFTGTVIVRGKKTGRPSQRLTLHGKGLKVTSAKIIKHDKKGEQDIELERINLQKSYDEIRLHAKGMVYPGDYTLTLEFEAPITRGMTGLYPCFFQHEGSEHTMLMTQFESHHARECFPCIDEPEAKATYDLSLTTPKDLTVLGNTPVKEQKTENNKLITTFETTPRMSSYLLAFVIGELHSKSTKTNRGTDVSVWGTIAQPAESFDFSLDIAKRSIEFFEEYFGVDYPLAKADHIACPDFSSGAMENWGLITYRERALLVYPGETAQSVQEMIATVVAHETSHQWFGNLVTMKWWDDLWLNESFANIMEYEAPDRMHPEWHIWDTFVAQEALSALRRDATPGVQPVKATVSHPDEISTLFDPSIVYAKGGRLLNMMKQYIGEPAFRKGLSAYFEKHKYGNTTGDDLWAALSEASGKDVAAFMNPWLEQSGFPVITVEQTDGELRFSQQHFLDNMSKADSNRKWPVPLFAGDDLPTLLDTKTITTAVKSPEPVLINRGAHGHYAVNYLSDAQRDALTAKIRDKSLSNGERLIALNDASMLARAGIRSYADVLQLLAAYDQEDAEPVWDMIALIVAELRRFIDLDDSLEDKVKAFVRTLITTELQRLGWETKDGESSADQKLRATIIGLGSYAEEPSVLEHAQELFDAYKSGDSKAVPAELRSIVFGVPVRAGKQDAIDYLLDLHQKTHSADLQADICGALTATRKPETAKMLLDRITDAKLVKPQDADRWLIYLLRNRYCGDTAWQWMVDNWQWIVDTYAQDKSYDMLPRYAATAANTQAQADRYREFFSPKTNEVPLKRNIEIGLEEIASRVAWLERDLPSVQKFFT